MATQTRDGSSTTGSTVLTPDDALTDDGNCAVAQNTLDTLLMTMNNFSVSGTYVINSYNVYVDAITEDNDTTYTVYVSKDGGSNFCAGHNIGDGNLPFNGLCSATEVRSFTCTHSNAPATKSEAENNTIVIKTITENTSLNNSRTDYVYHEIDYTLVSPPDAQDLVSATTPEDSMIRVTRNSTYPNGNGDPVDSWEVWRSSTSGGTYTEIASGLTATTYDDWSVDGGETWYYKAKFTNIAGDSALSTNPVNATATTPEITKTSDSRILIPDNEITDTSDTHIKAVYENSPLSDSAIFRAGFDTKTKTSDSTVQIIISKTIFSNSNIFRPGFDTKMKISDSTVEIVREISRVANTNILNSLKVTTLSDTVILREEIDTKEKISDSRIKNSFTISNISFSKIKAVYSVNTLSDSAIFHPSFGLINKISQERIVAEGTSVLSVDSDSSITTSFSFTKTSDSFIVLGQEITKLSDSAIYRSSFNTLNIPTNSAIHVDGYDTKLKLSDSAIFKGDIEITKLSDTIIKREAGYLYPNQTKKLTNDTIIKVSKEKLTRSLSRILKLNEVSKLSDILVIHNIDIQKISNSIIKTINNKLLKQSEIRILNSFESILLSNSAIERKGFSTIVKSSNTFIDRKPILNLNSESVILKSIEKTILVDTYIINKGIDISILSGSSIFRADFGLINKTSLTAIEGKGLKKIKISDTVILNSPLKNILSDVSIRRDRSSVGIIFEKSRQL